MADSRHLGFHRSGRAWANTRDLFRRKPSRIGRGRRAAVCVFFSGVFGMRRDVVCLFVFFASSAHGLLYVSVNLASFTSLVAIVSRAMPNNRHRKKQLSLAQDLKYRGCVKRWQGILTGFGSTLVRY